MFQMYARNLRRIYWADFIDVHVHLVRSHDLVAKALPEQVTLDAEIAESAESLVPTCEYSRHRTTSVS